MNGNNSLFSQAAVELSTTILRVLMVVINTSLQKLKGILYQLLTKTSHRISQFLTKHSSSTRECHAI